MACEYDASVISSPKGAGLARGPAAALKADGRLEQAVYGLQIDAKTRTPAPRPSPAIVIRFRGGDV